MKVFDSLKKKAEESKKVIVFPEGNDDRIIKAAVRLEKEGIVKPLLLGKPDEVIKTAQSLNVDLGSIEIINPAVYPDFEKMCQDFVELRKGKNTLAEAKKILQDVSYFGTMLVYEGKADGMVSGATHSTANTVRPALQIIKTKKGMSRVSGAMIMERGDEKYIFADCAINIDPDSETLAEIAYQSSKTAEMIGLEPKIAMLSFSTKGSAKGPMVTKVQEATELVHQKYPELICDGELQLDSAIIPEIAERKAPGSPVAGKANTLIFPDLDAGNIGYKLVQRLAKAEAYGPLCQGIAKPVNDLSRGCSSEDIAGVIAITAVQAQTK